MEPTDKLEKNLLCPSSPGHDGSLLLGVIQHDRTVSLLETPLEVDYTFIESSKNLGLLEKRFRFANTCLEGECKQWTGSACGVIKMLSEINKHLTEDNTLKPCSIREKCRWYHENGSKACTSCTYVTSNLQEADPIDIYQLEDIHESNN